MPFDEAGSRSGPGRKRTMSFRLFIYWCALCGGAGAFIGWALGRAWNVSSATLSQGIKGLFLGLALALALGLVDALWVVSPGRVFAVAGRVGIVILIGALGGLLGGLVGQALYEMGGNGFFLVLGWVIIGMLVGASLGVFDLLWLVFHGQPAGGALRKVRNGLFGGTAGGLLGGALAQALHGAWGGLFAGKPVERLWSPSSWGFVALGLCIGLLIGLAQVIFKEAWLRVEKGFRAGRELLLTKPETSIGRAETCDVGLFGDPAVERLHAVIRREGDHFVLRDTGTPGGTYVNGERVVGPRPLRSGDAIRLGRCLLRFGERQRSSATTPVHAPLPS